MTIEIRDLVSPQDMRAAERLFDEIWDMDDDQVIPASMLLAALAAGHQVLGAYEGDALVGASWGFLTYDGSEVGLHSHITGVLQRHQGAGLGYRLKMAQRDWCLARGIATVTWTFDPMVARNAAFNLRKLGATGVRFLADHYGEMGDRFNAGEPSDRVEIVWDLTAEAREQQKPQSAILIDVDGVPGRVPPGDEPISLAVPSDYHALRSKDPQRAAFWRDAVRGSMSYLFGHGLRATGFDPEHGYLFTPPSAPPP